MIDDNKIFLLEEIVKKNFAAKYKDSFLGIIWSVLKPLMVMILLTIIFATLFGKDIINYPVYFLSGKCIFDFFNLSTSLSTNSLKGNKNILCRTNAPKYIFVLGSVISEFINFLITLVILVFVMIVTNVSFNFVFMPLSIIPVLSLVMISIGISLMLSIFCVYYTDVQHLWSIVSLLLMYASAIFYPMDIIPNPFHDYMILNPIFWVIDQFRNLVIYETIPDPLNIINLLLISLITLVIGILIFKKFEHKIIMKF